MLGAPDIGAISTPCLDKISGQPVFYANPPIKTADIGTEFNQALRLSQEPKLQGRPRESMTGSRFRSYQRHTTIAEPNE
jgi:hypothetical protein